MNTLSTQAPVCGMETLPDQTAGKSEVRGVVYYFCSDDCRAKFENNRARCVEPGRGVPEPNDVRSA